MADLLAPITPTADDDTSFFDPIAGRRREVDLDSFYARYPEFVEDPLTVPVDDSMDWADYGRSVMAGGASVVSGVGWFQKTFGMGPTARLGEMIETLGNDAVEAWNESLSPAAKREMAKEFVVEAEDGEGFMGYEWGDASLKTVGLYGAQSLLGTAAGAGIGAGATKTLQLFGNPAGRSVLTTAIEAGKKAPVGHPLWKKGQAAAKKLKFVDSVLGAVGFGFGEGSISAIMQGSSVEREVMNLPDEKFLNNERFMQIYNSTDQLMDPDDAWNYAKQTIAKEAAMPAAFKTGLTTGLLGAPMGAYFGPLFSRQLTGKVGSILKGGTGEAAQEFFQSGTEKYIENTALIDLGAERTPFEGVLNEAIGGAAAGFGLGAGMSTAQGAPAPQEDPKFKTPTPSPVINESGVNLGPVERLAEEALAVGAAPEEVEIIKKGALEKGQLLPAVRRMRQLIEDRKAGMTVEDEYLQRTAAEAPVAEAPEKPVEPEAKPRSTEFDPAQDSLLEAISKLGGLNTEEAIAQGIDPAEKGELGYGIGRVFQKGGETFDGMAERLGQYGYPVQDEDGKYTANKLLELVDEEMAGTRRTYTPQGAEAQMEREAYEAELASWQQYNESEGLEEPPPPRRVKTEYDEEADDEARRIEDLFELAAQVDEAAAETILEKAESDGDAAIALWEIVSGETDTRGPRASDEFIEKQAALGRGEAIDRQEEAGQEAGQEVATTGLTVEFEGTKFPVESLEDAQQKWVQFRTESNIGASDMSGIDVLDAAGNKVARIAYNGKIQPTTPEAEQKGPDFRTSGEFSMDNVLEQEPARTSADADIYTTTGVFSPEFVMDDVLVTAAAENAGINPALALQNEGNRIVAMVLGNRALYDSAEAANGTYERRYSGGQPVVFLEYEYGMVVDTPGQGMQQGESKRSFGRLVAVRPVFEELDLSGSQALWGMSQENPVYQKHVTRNEYKLALGKPGLVNDALRMNRGKFLKQLEAAEAKLIQDKLKLTPQQFWANVNRGSIEHARTIARPSKQRDKWAANGRSMLPAEQIGQQQETELKLTSGEELVKEPRPSEPKENKPTGAKVRRAAAEAAESGDQQLFGEDEEAVARANAIGESAAPREPVDPNARLTGSEETITTTLEAEEGELDEGWLVIHEGDNVSLSVSRQPEGIRWGVEVNGSDNIQQFKTYDQAYPAWEALQEDISTRFKTFGENVDEDAFEANIDGINDGSMTTPPEAVFPDPGTTLSLEKKAKDAGVLDQEEADAIVNGWKAAAKAVGEQYGEENRGKVILSMFDHSGEWSKPWRDAGYTVVQMDKFLGDDIMMISPNVMVAEIQAEFGPIHGILAACPCTSFAGSGARWWHEQHDQPNKEMVRAKYGDTAAEYFDRPLDYGTALVDMTKVYVEFTQTEFHVLENPVGRIAEKALLPKPTAQFQPSNFGDPYTKRTQLWGKFNPDLPVANVNPVDGSKMQSKLSSGDPRRSLTPEGFAYAFFMANDPNAQAAYDNAIPAPVTIPEPQYAEKQAFGPLTINEEIEIEETGEIVEVSINAQKAFDDAVRRRKQFEQLARCING